MDLDVLHKINNALGDAAPEVIGQINQNPDLFATVISPKFCSDPRDKKQEEFVVHLGAIDAYVIMTDVEFEIFALLNSDKLIITIGKIVLLSNHQVLSQASANIPVGFTDTGMELLITTYRQKLELSKILGPRHSLLMQLIPVEFTNDDVLLWLAENCTFPILVSTYYNNFVKETGYNIHPSVFGRFAKRIYPNLVRYYDAGYRYGLR